MPNPLNPLMGIGMNPLFAMGTQLLSNSLPGPTYRPMFQGVPQAMALSAHQAMLMEQLGRDREESEFQKKERARLEAERKRREGAISGLNPLDTATLGRQLVASGDPELAIAGIKMLHNSEIAQQNRIYKGEETADERAFKSEQNELNRQARVQAGGGGSSYFMPVPTPGGVYAFNARTGTAAPVMGPAGQPIVKSADDPTLQGQITGAKTGAKKEEELRAELTKNYPKEVAKLRLVSEKVGRLKTTVDQAIGQSNQWFASGVGSGIASKFAATPATNLRSTLETIKGNLGFNELQQMRDASPTGGALGQVAVQELMALQSTIASLDPSQSDQQIQANLAKVRSHLDNWQKAVEMSYADKYGSMDGPAVAANPAGGVKFLGFE